MAADYGDDPRDEQARRDALQGEARQQHDNAALNQPLMPRSAGTDAAPACDDNACSGSPLQAIATAFRNLVGAESVPLSAAADTRGAPSSTRMQRDSETNAIDDATDARMRRMEDTLALYSAALAEQRAGDARARLPDTPLATDLYVPFTVDATSLAAVHATPAAARGASDANTADKPDPDGAVPDEDSGGQPGPNGYIKALTTKEIEANTTSIAPGEVAGWQEWTLPALAKHTPLWAACIELSPEQYAKRLRADPNLRAQDEHNASMIIAMLDSSHLRVKNFKSTVSASDREEREAGIDDMPRTAASGYRLWHAIAKSALCGTGATRTARVRAFKEKGYFTAGMTNEAVIDAANSLRADFELLPPSERRGDNALIRAMLDKMPSAIDDETAAYLKKLEKREALGKPPKWTYEELTALIAIDLAALDSATIKSLGDRGGGRKQCVRCGAFGHLAGDKDANGRPVCTAVCGECDSRICPGCRPGERCAVMADAMPPITELKNGKGMAYAPKIYEQLAAYRTQKRASLNLPSTKAMRADAATGGDGYLSTLDDGVTLQ